MLYVWYNKKFVKSNLIKIENKLNNIIYNILLKNTSNNNVF